MWRLCLILLFWLAALPAAAQDRYASIIVDADTLDVLHARQIDAERFPASLTKIMTLYVTFEAIERGEIALDATVRVSAHAAATPPVKMGLRRGQDVRLDTLIQAVAVRSSNDAAVAIAEAVGGSEEAFVARMNDAAKRLTMQRTTFRNPHGLPDAEQHSTARDMAKLAHATLTRFPQHYHYFGQTEFRGRRNTNALLRSREDVDGFKTGYTRASGYNLVISATRDGRRLLAVVLGGASSGSRNTHMSDLIDRGWAVMDMTAPIEPKPVRMAEAHAQPLAPQVFPVGHSSSPPIHWALQIDGFD
ncbi:MAG: D-alanyl-D-alanine carboxypeptidase family protein, partial [Litorimonas sp.]